MPLKSSAVNVIQYFFRKIRYSSIARMRSKIRSLQLFFFASCSQLVKHSTCKLRGLLHFPLVRAVYIRRTIREWRQKLNYAISSNYSLLTLEFISNLGLQMLSMLRPQSPRRPTYMYMLFPSYDKWLRGRWWFPNTPSVCYSIPVSYVERTFIKKKVVHLLQCT